MTRLDKILSRGFELDHTTPLKSEVYVRGDIYIIYDPKKDKILRTYKTVFKRYERSRDEARV